MTVERLGKLRGTVGKDNMAHVGLKDMIDIIIEDYFEDYADWLELNPQELEPDCLLREDVEKVAQEKAKAYGKYLSNIPRYRVQALYDSVLNDYAQAEPTGH